jgi:predicted kinase
MAQPGGVLTLLEQPVVVVLVGAAGSGKTTFRRSLVAAGYDAGRVVSLDDLRRCERAADAAAGRPVRSLQDYSLRAVRRAQRRCDALADATHLRRRERMAHVRVAADCGLPAVAVLLPDLTLATLLHRDAERPPDERVPTEVLAKQAHRRSLLSVGLLAGEGFAEVLEGTSHSFNITA